MVIFSEVYMNAHDNDEGGITLLDAVQALSSIAESQWENLHEVADQDIQINFSNAAWLRSRDSKEVVGTVKEIFKVILNHIKNFYHTEYAVVTDTKTLEGIKAMMVLVGEAAKKIDRFTDIFHQKTLSSVTQLREYKQLQDFYRRKISRTIDEALLGKWILGLTQRTFREDERVLIDGTKALETKHVFVDLDSVKKDTEYELFFIRKEDGSRFFSPRLIRNIKLVCDFGAYLGMEKEKDPFVDHEIWQDRMAHAKGESIFRAVKPILDRYYADIAHGKENAWIGTLNKAIIALINCASKNRLISSGSTKGCAAYLANFKEFLRETIHCSEYQHLVAFPTKNPSIIQEAAIKIIDALLEAVMKHVVSLYSMRSYLQYLLKESEAGRSTEHKREAVESGLIWNRLASDYAGMQKLMKRHPNGPVSKVIKLLEEGNYQKFDPYLQQQMAESVFQINENLDEIDVICLPTPTSQEFIQEAKLNEEFLAILRKPKNSILLINLQDSTSWREFARVNALQKLSKGTEFDDKLTVITLAKDTEFYHQESPYNEDNQLQLFKEHLRENILDSQAGFFIPEKIQNSINKNWIEATFDAISRVFFSGKNVLLKDSRVNFIELFYLFITLKSLEVSQAKTLFLICKDGLDIGPAATGLLFLFLKLIKGNTLKLDELNRITEILYIPALLSRERIMLFERFQRMLGAVKVIENAFHEHGAENFAQIMHKEFGELFQSDILNSIAQFERQLEEEQANTKH